MLFTLCDLGVRWILRCQLAPLSGDSGEEEWATGWKSSVSRSLFLREGVRKKNWKIVSFCQSGGGGGLNLYNASQLREAVIYVLAEFVH